MPSTVWRHAPLQDRARARVDKILDAAAAILTEEGWEALNTNALAKRAGVPVGSVYQYFPNKQAVARVMAQRSLSRLDALVAGLVPRGAFRWEALVDRMIDALARFWSEEPGYRGGLIAAAGLGDAERQLDERLAGRVDALLGRAAPKLPAARRREAALGLVVAMGPLLSSGLAEEAKRLLKCRIKTCVEEGK